MRLHRIRSPLAPLKKGGDNSPLKVPLFKGDLGGSRSVQRPIKLVLHHLNPRLLQGVGDLSILLSFIKALRSPRQRDR
jgi:hypothetical protein